MDILSFVGKAGIVVAIIIILLFIKKGVNEARVKQGLDEVGKIVWILAAFGGGIVGALIANISMGFSEFNLGTFIYDAFIYAAAAGYLYNTGKVVIEKIDIPK